MKTRIRNPDEKNYLHSDDNWITFKICKLGNRDFEEVGVSFRPRKADMINLPLKDELPRANIVTVSIEHHLDILL